MHLPVKAGQAHKMNSVRWCPCYWPHRRCVNHAGAFRAPLDLRWIFAHQCILRHIRVYLLII